jgi:hypothetical protein
MAAATIAGGALFGACNRGPSEREKQLEQRVQELEQQQRATASPEASGWPDVAESPAARPDYTLAPEPAPAKPAAPRASSGSRPASRPAPRAEAAAAAPVAAPRAPVEAAPATPSREPVERIPDEEAARADNDWPADQPAVDREPTRRASDTVVVPANTQLSLRL